MSEKQVKWAKQQRVRRRRKRDYLTRKDVGISPTELIFLNDPKWPQMWYLNRGSGLDMSVEGAWREGITGKGIVVTILDDGLEKDHPDLKENYDSQASYDVNGHDDNPMPRYDMIDSNRHGTRCAGEVAAVANNSVCSLGIAFGANVGGVRMLDGDVTDAVEARSLSLNPQHIDIYSASWGPDDDGKTVDGPGELAMRAFIEGVTKGRGGRGSIFVWASGNGGRDHDNCNCDGYTNSIWTLSISSATEHGLVPWYSEACSSTLATTYSSGSTGEKQVVTTDLHHQCTSSHTGTSASAPLAAGICALVLEANPSLTWRDMQHIVVLTARPANLNAPDWTVNGVGRNVSHSFGYGLMDAAAMVKLSKTWRTVPEQHKCEVSAPHSDKVIPAKSSVTLHLNVKECAGVNYLEHVQAKISLMSQRRGDLEIQLVSPGGTRTTLLARRPHDVSRSGFRSWPFMSVHTWGEHPLGVWTLEIHNEGRFLGRATLQEWSLIFYGTEGAPPLLGGGSRGAVVVVPQPPPRTAHPLNLPPAQPPKRNKPSRKNKSANPTSRPGKGKTRRPPASTTPFTILLAPPPQPSTHLFPAIFQQYHKVQQLFPYSRMDEPPPRPSKKGLEHSDTPKESAKLTDWNQIFYGTETEPVGVGSGKGGGTSAPLAGGGEAESSATYRGGGQSSSSAAAAAGAAAGGSPYRGGQELTSDELLRDMAEDGPPTSGCQIATRSCLECRKGLYMWRGKCEGSCPHGTWASESGRCQPCHYSCGSCDGPNDYQCSSCHSDAYPEAAAGGGGETLCYPKSLRPALDTVAWYYWTTLALLLNSFLVVACALVFFLRQKGCRCRQGQTLLDRPGLVLDSAQYKLTAEDTDSDN